MTSEQIWDPSWSHVGPSWRHVGGLGASWGSSWRSWAPSWLQDAPRCQMEPPRPPQTSIFINFRTVFQTFSQHFHRFKLQVESEARLQFSARWRLCARNALDIRRPRVAGGRACVNRVSKSIKSFLSNPSRKSSRGSAARAQMAAAARMASISHSLFRLQLAILGRLWPSWSLSFFQIFQHLFLYRFWHHCGSQNGINILPKSIQNRSKNLIEKLSTFGIIFSSIFHGFGSQLNLKKRQKRCEGCIFLCFR